MSFTPITRRIVWGVESVLTSADLNNEFDRFKDMANTALGAVEQGATSDMSAHNTDTDAHLNLRTVYVGAELPEAASYRFAFITEGEDAGFFFCRDADGNWTKWFHKDRPPLDARDGGDFQSKTAANLADGSVTAAALTPYSYGDTIVDSATLTKSISTPNVLTQLDGSLTIIQRGGDVRTRFECQGDRASAGSFTLSAQLYRNNVAIGNLYTQPSNSSPAPFIATITLKIQDIPDWNKDDVITVKVTVTAATVNYPVAVTATVSYATSGTFVYL